MKMIIGVNGLARHGKDTVADMICEEFLSAAKVAYATPLKHVAQYVFGLTPEQVETTLGKAQKPDSGYGLSCRQIMQRVGTEAFRSVFSDRIWLDWMDRNLPAVDVVVKSDVRFANEIAHTREQGEKFNCPAVNIKVINTRKLPNLADVICGGGMNMPVQVGEHVSETVFPDSEFDYVIYNDGTLEDLRKKVVKIVQELADRIIYEEVHGFDFVEDQDDK